MVFTTAKIKQLTRYWTGKIKQINNTKIIEIKKQRNLIINQFFCEKEDEKWINDKLLQQK